MSQNIQQIFVANPAAAMVNTDLFYLGRSPYGVTNDMAILWSNVLASIATSFPQIGTWVDQTTATVTMTANTGYTADAGASLITFTLPVTSAIGDFVEINGKAAGLWTIAQAAGQQIRFGSSSTTSGVGGSLSSILQFDNIRLRCITANLTWTVVSVQGTITVV